MAIDPAALPQPDIPERVPTATRVPIETSVLGPAESSLAARGLQRGLPQESQAFRQRQPRWDLAAVCGRFVEVSGSSSGAALTLVFRLVHEAQRNGEPVAWIGRKQSVFFPPDVAEVGIDLDALAVIWTPNAMRATRVADYLIRSGGFGLVLLDMGPRVQLSIPIQARLVGLAQKHKTALLCLTEKEAQHPSVSPLVSLRAEAQRTDLVDGRFRCQLKALKDKRLGPGWNHTELYHGPDGLH